MLYGRGAVDMKGGIACFVAAALDHLAANGGKPKGLDLAPDHRRRGERRGQRHDQAAAVGGGARRDIRSLRARRAEQRRGARRHHQDRPARLAQRHAGRHRQAGPRRLSRSRRQSDPRPGHADRRAAGAARPGQRAVRSVEPRIHLGRRRQPTVNLIPGEARARFNIRFNDCHSQASLEDADRAARARPPPAGACAIAFEWQPSNADVFLTKPGPFTDLVVAAIAEVTGRTPKLSTTGGTSDARFIKDYCPVLEFGLVGQTMHQVDECAAGRRPRHADRDLPPHHRAVFRYADRRTARLSHRHDQ